jgi:hypothetical protein
MAEGKTALQPGLPRSLAAITFLSKNINVVRASLSCQALLF